MTKWVGRSLLLFKHCTPLSVTLVYRDSERGRFETDETATPRFGCVHENTRPASKFHALSSLVSWKHHDSSAHSPPDPSWMCLLAEYRSGTHHGAQSGNEKQILLDAEMRTCSISSGDSQTMFDNAEAIVILGTS